MDDSIAADILREASGTPEAAESDRGSARTSRPARQPAAEANDETADELDTETESTADEESETEETDTAAETETEAAGEESQGDEPTADAPAAEAADKDGTPEWAKKRFAEYARKVENLERQLAEARNPQQAQSAAGIRDMEILQLETPEQVARVREQLEQVIDVADANPNGIEADPSNPQAKSFTPEQLQQAKINSRHRLRELDRREKQLDMVAKFNAAAHQEFPEFNDPDSEGARTLGWVLSQVPELRRLPGYRMIIADSIMNARRRVKDAEAKASAKKDGSGKPLPGKPVVPAARKAPPVVNGAPSRGTAAPAGKQLIRQKARTRAMESGSEADIANLVEASLG